MSVASLWAVACIEAEENADGGGGAGGSEPATGGTNGATGGGGATGGQPAEGGVGGEGVSGEGGADTEPPVDTSVRSCRRLVETTEFGLKESGTVYFVNVCALDHPIRHVRIERALAPAPHGSTQILLGASSAPVSSNPVPGTGQFKVMLYGGGSGGRPPASLSVLFAVQNSELAAAADWVHTSSTICFDLLAGSEAMPPRIIAWRDGVNGANCDDRITLTLESASFSELHWDGETAGDVNDTNLFFRQTSQNSTVYLSDESAVDPSDIPEPIRG